MALSQNRSLKKFETSASQLEIFTEGLDNIVIENTNSNFIECIFDQSKLKIGKYLPGTHIPILDPKKIKEFDFDILLIMPWNIKNEIINLIDISVTTWIVSVFIACALKLFEGNIMSVAGKP